MNKPPKKHRGLFIIYRILAILVVLLVILAIGLKLYFTPARVKSLTEHLIKQTFNRETKIGSFDLSLFRGLVAKQIEISNLPGFSSQPILTIKEIDLQYNFWSIIKKKPQVYRIVVRDPVLSIEKNQQGNWNFTDLLQSKLKNYRLNQIEIINAELLVRPYPELNLTKANIVLQDIRPWKPWKFNIQGILTAQPESQISMIGALNVFTLVPTGDITVSVKNLNPMLPFKQQIKSTKLDQLSLITNGTIKISSPQSMPITISGAITAESIRYPILQNTPWNGRTEFILSYSYESNRIEISSVKFNIADFPEVTGTGSIESFFGESTIHLSIQSMEGNLQPFLARLAKPYPNLSGTGKIQLARCDIFIVPSRKIVRVGSAISLTNIHLIDKNYQSELSNGNMEIGLSYTSPIETGKNPLHINIQANADKVLVKDILIQPTLLSLNLELDQNLALNKFNMPTAKLLVADAPVSIQASGDKKNYRAMVMMKNFELSRIPESILTKSKFPKTNGMVSGNLDIIYVPSIHTSFSAIGNFKIDNLSIIQTNKTYALGNIRSGFESIVNLTNRTISFRNLELKSDRNLSIQGTAELHDLGRGIISGQYSISPISIPDLKPYISLVNANPELPAVDGIITGKGTFSYRPAPAKIIGSLDLAGSALRYQNTSALLSVKTSTINLSFENKEPDILYSKASILFKGFETQYANNTIIGDLNGITEIYTYNRFSQITGTIILDTTNINIPSSKLFAKGVHGNANFTIQQKDNGSSTILFTSQLENLRIGELINPWIEAKDISLSADIKPEKVMVNRLNAQIEGGELNTQVEISLTAPAKAYLKGSINNIKSADILQQLNAYYPIPYNSTSGTISVKFDGNFDTLTTGIGNLRLNLNKINLVKDDITYIRKLNADIGIDFNKQMLTVQPTQLDIEGKVKPLISGQITKLFSTAPEPQLMITLDTTSLSIAQDVFFEFLPSLLQDADISGIIAAAVNASKPDKDWQLLGRINLDKINMKLGKTLALSNIHGYIPLETAISNQSDYFQYRFRQENYNSWISELKKYESANQANLQIDSIDAGILTAKNLVLAPIVYPTGARVPMIKLNLFGGTIYGRALTDAKGEYTIILLLNNLSLKQICDSQDSIRGMISGRFNGMILLNGPELGLNKLRGTVQLWSIPSKEEPRSFSKEFLEKAAGRKLPPLFIQRNYDEAKLALTIQDGYLVFDDFLMVGRMFGRPMTSIGIDPRGNKVSLNNFIDWMVGLESGTGKIKTEIK
jgi:hypothetical protein